MQRIVEWVDQHPNKTNASVKRRFRKVKQMFCITIVRQYIQMNGGRSEKLSKIKEFMWNEFYVK